MNSTAKEKPRPGTSVSVKNFQELERKVLMQFIKSDKERHHLSKYTAKDVNNKRNQIPNNLDEDNTHEDTKKCEDCRHKDIKRRGQPVKCTENNSNHL